MICGRVVAGVALAALLAGCQLVDTPGGDVAQQAQGTAAEDDTALGSPAEDWPETTAEVRAVAAPEAQSWQDDPVLADLTTWLTADGAFERVRATYVAGDAERMLTYRATPEDLRVERPRLAGLQLPVLPVAAVEAIPPFPDDALEPAALAAASAGALGECGAAGDPVRAVLYATGAPAAWDGSAWTRTPSWRATVVAEGAGVVVDPTSGQAFAPLTCVEPILIDVE